MQKFVENACVCAQKVVTLQSKPKKKQMQTILIVDDEPDIREILTFNLEQAGYACLTAADGRQALAQLSQHGVDVVLLDVMMPRISGFELAQQIRNDEVPGVPYDLPIIFLTALGEEEDQLRGFSLGADDYIAKPFSLRLLLARIEARIRRQSFDGLRSRTEPEVVLRQAQEPSPGVEYESLRLSDSTFVATLDGRDIGLTKMEYELLHFLLLHQGIVYSRRDLLNEVWPDNGLVLDRTVDVTITRLRKKIGPYKEHLKAKVGYGYYWEK